MPLVSVSSGRGSEHPSSKTLIWSAYHPNLCSRDEISGSVYTKCVTLNISFNPVPRIGR